jgi:hypothetical protein
LISWLVAIYRDLAFFTAVWWNSVYSQNAITDWAYLNFFTHLNQGGVSRQKTHANSLANGGKCE